MHNCTIKPTSLLVEAVHEPTGEVVAKAVRTATNSNWFVGTLVSKPDAPNHRFMINVAEVRGIDFNGYAVSEVRQRKLVIAMVQSLADSL